jgi:uncharacterized protein (TIGR00725 family)
LVNQDTNRPFLGVENMRIVSVIGTSTADQAIWNNAYQVGRLLAEHNCVVVCGGRGGVMEAVCKGVAEKGGLSIGILPGDRSEANKWVTFPLSTCLGEARNTVVVSSGEVVISIGGAYGTLSEIGFALKMGRTVIALGTWQICDENGQPAPLLHAQTPEEAVAMALEKLKEERNENE